MQIPTFIIAILLGIGAILTAVFSSVYNEKKDTKMIGGIVVGVLLYVAGIGLFGMNNKIGAGMIAVGSILLALCSYFYSKKICDTSSSSSNLKKGLVSGIVIGVVFLAVGLAIPYSAPALNNTPGDLMNGANMRNNYVPNNTVV